jgi:hypothetical protein
MGFQEFTATDGGDEVMLDVDTETGKVIDLYTYKDRYLRYYNERTGEEVELSKNWQPNLNPLFVHCPKNRIKFSLEKILGEDFYVLADSEDIDETAENSAILHKMIKFHKLPEYCEAMIVVG